MVGRGAPRIAARGQRSREVDVRGVAVLALELVDEGAAVEAQHVRIGAKEALDERVAGQESPLLVLERAQVLPADLGACLEIDNVEVLPHPRLAERRTDTGHIDGEGYRPRNDFQDEGAPGVTRGQAGGETPRPPPAVPQPVAAPPARCRVAIRRRPPGPIRACRSFESRSMRCPRRQPRARPRGCARRARRSPWAGRPRSRARCAAWNPRSRR